MGFQFSALFDIMWNHPLVCGSILLLLTPSLFHILLYFSPLLISTTLFVIALISMGPRMDETREERERWAKGEKPMASVEEVWPYPDWSQPSEPVLKKKRGFFSEDATWVDWVEEAKNKFKAWVDVTFRAGDASSFKPLVSEAAALFATTTSNVADHKDMEDHLNPREVPAAAAAPNEQKIAPASEDVSKTGVSSASDQHAGSSETVEVPVPEPNVVAASKVQEIDMPELELVDPPSLEERGASSLSQGISSSSVLDEKKTGDAAGPIWDEVPVPGEIHPVPGDDDDLLEVPLDEPVQEPLHEEKNIPQLNKEVNSASDEEEAFPKKAKEESTQAKHVHFTKDATAAAPAASGNTPSARDAHKRILKELHSHLEELQSKRRNKYSQVLSRRMSMKLGDRN